MKFKKVGYIKNSISDLKSEDKNLYFIFLRYLIILLLGLGNIYVFYAIFTPLTLYPVYYILKLFFTVGINGTSIYIGSSGFFNSSHVIELIPACIAGSAYYLLFILNMATYINFKKRLYSLIYSFILLLILNILRIIIISILFISNSLYFELTHKIFWYSLSIFFVVLIWFSEVIFFKIKNIPIYSDFLEIKKAILK